MANTYTHRVISLKKENGVYLNMIKSFVIEVTASDGTNSFSKEYTVKIDLPEPEDFVEYNNLTEQDIISWLTTNDLEYEFIKTDIDKELEESLQDDVESNFPWL